MAWGHEVFGRSLLVGSQRLRRDPSMGTNNFIEILFVKVCGFGRLVMSAFVFLARTHHWTSNTNAFHHVKTIYPHCVTALESGRLVFFAGSPVDFVKRFLCQHHTFLLLLHWLRLIFIVDSSVSDPNVMVKVLLARALDFAPELGHVGAPASQSPRSRGQVLGPPPENLVFTEQLLPLSVFSHGSRTRRRRLQLHQEEETRVVLQCQYIRLISGGRALSGVVAPLEPDTRANYSIKSCMVACVFQRVHNLRSSTLSRWESRHLSAKKRESFSQQNAPELCPRFGRVARSARVQRGGRSE